MPDSSVPFKEVPGDDLMLHFFFPEDWKPTDRRPAIVFFFGGGWVRGSPSQFFPQSAYLSSRGMVAISAQYRTRNSHGVQAEACVQDGKSAIRWVRQNAARFGIDPDRIAVGGGSAGGQIALMAELGHNKDEELQGTPVFSRSNALVLFNPVLDTSESGVGYKAFGDNWQAFSPMHNIRAGMPPTLILLGTADELIPVSTAEAFKAIMSKAGAACQLVLYDGEKHGFFNKSKYTETLMELDKFLVKLGYLPVDQRED